MRVLELSWEYPPVTQGGLARHVRGLARALVAQGAEVEVLTRGPRAGSEQPDGFPVHRVPASRFPADVDAFLGWVTTLNAALVTRGSRLLARSRVDVVHSHDWLVASAGRRVAALAGVPWVVTVHATEHGRHAGWVGEPPQSTIHAAERRMVRDADHVIVCSEWMRAHVAGVFGVCGPGITVLRNGVDPDAADAAAHGEPAAARGRRAPDGGPRVLLAGRLMHEKGFDLALDALAPILSARRDVRVTIAGAGTGEAALREQSRRLGLTPYLDFLGWVEEAELQALYRACDVCVVPSRYEPFGLVALEAMAAGCACVVADVGGLREIVPGDGSAGLRVAADDPAALRGALERVLGDDGLRTRLGVQARRHARRFGWADVAQATAERLEGVVAAAAAAGPLNGSAAPACPRSR